MARTKKQDIVTFKVDASLREALERLPNRSEFIRDAIRAALKGTCPLCGGTGTLTADARKHWEAFAQRHTLCTCDDCHAVHLVCLDHRREANRIHGERH
jgi:hypothetical protein